MLARRPATRLAIGALLSCAAVALLPGRPSRCDSGDSLDDLDAAWRQARQQLRDLEARPHTDAESMRLRLEMAMNMWAQAAGQSSQKRRARATEYVVLHCSNIASFSGDPWVEGLLDAALDDLLVAPPHAGPSGSGLVDALAMCVSWSGRVRDRLRGYLQHPDWSHWHDAIGLALAEDHAHRSEWGELAALLERFAAKSENADAWLAVRRRAGAIRVGYSLALDDVRSGLDAIARWSALTAPSNYLLIATSDSCGMCRGLAPEAVRLPSEYAEYGVIFLQFVRSDASEPLALELVSDRCWRLMLRRNSPSLGLLGGVPTVLLLDRDMRLLNADQAKLRSIALALCGLR